MNFNKYFIFIVFFVLILSVSTVNATDNLDTNDNLSSNLINTEYAVYSDSSSISKNWTVDEFLNNYNVIQDNDVVLLRNGLGSPTGTIVLNQNGITIFTEGNVIFDCQGKNFHFEIKGSNVLIQGITFKNFNFTGNGGAIQWSGDNGTLTNCTFINNNVTNYAGAVRWDGNNGVLSSSNFTSNTAGRYGGSVYWGGVNGTLSNCTFSNNNATWGGSVCWDGINGSLTSCTFFNNNATYGGGVFWFGANGILSDSSFINNTADFGGAIMWDGADGSLSDSIFTGNTANTYGGGSVYWGGSNGVLSGSTFTRNTARTYGGGILWNGGKGIIKNSTFKDNAAKYGSAVHWSGVDGTLTSCTFFNNNATSGGSVHWGGSNGTLTSCTFFNNNATWGGSVYWGGSNGSLTSCTFNNNTAISNGGAIMWAGDNGNLSDSIFTANTANFNYGGAVEWDGANGVLSGSTFTSNAASSYGGGVFWFGANGILSDSSFINNTADFGGAVCWSVVGHVVNCTFLNSRWVKTNGIYARNNLNIEGGKGIVDVFTTNTLSGITVIVLDNETYYLSPNQDINITCKIMSGNLTIVDSSNDVFKFYINGIESIVKPEISDKGEYYMNYTSSTPDTLVVSGNYAKASSATKYKNGTLIFKDGLDDPDLNVTFDQDTVTVTLNNQTTGHVIVYVNGIRHILNIVDGKASLHVSDSSGHYNVTVVYPGDANFKSAELSNEFDTDSAHVLEAEDIVKYFRNGTQYHVSLKDGYSNPISGKRITVTLVNSRHTNPVQYVIITDSRGIATLVINANPAMYYATAVYGNQSVTNTITVLAPGYSIDAEDIFMTFKDGTSYTARLTSSDGAPVPNVYISIFLKTKSSGKLYKVLTDVNGVATLSINLNPGQYTMTAEYMGEAVTTRLVVLSGSYIIMAEDIVKYFKNGTQYHVKVTDLNGNPVSGQKVSVTIKSPRWTKQAYYNITTDGNGIATLAINLSPGQYTAEVKIGSDTVQSKITVLPTLTSENLIKPVNQPGNLVAKLVDGQGKPASGKTLTFTVKTKTYTKTTDSNGLASLPINLGVGNWKIDIVNPETGAKATSKIIIAKATA